MDRLRSPRGSHGRRLSSLTDFEFRVWDQYQLSADDFGVMRCSALTIMEANASLEDRPVAMVMDALERMLAVGLVLEFHHQGRRYLCQDDWQEFQRVEYPRRTMLPAPTEEVLERCCPKTQELFRKHPGGESKRTKTRANQNDFQAVPEESPRVSRAVPEDSSSDTRGFPSPRVTANTNGKRLTANGNSEKEEPQPQPTLTPRGVRVGGLSGTVDPEVGKRAGHFIDRFCELYTKHRDGATYLVRPAKDWGHACNLVSTFDSERLERITVVFLNSNEPFIQKTNRGLAVFESQASWCDEQLRKAEKKLGAMN